AFGSAVFYTAFDVGVRSFLQVSAVWEFMFIRGLLGLILAGAAVSTFRPAGGLAAGWSGRLKWLVLGGLCAFASSVCNLTALIVIPLYQALVLLYLHPVFSLVLAWPVNGEPPTRENLVLVALAAVGCLILVWPDEAAGLVFSSGHVLALTGALLYSLGQVFFRALGRGNTGLEPTLAYSVFAVLLAWPLALVFGGGFHLDRFDRVDRELVAALALLGLAAQGTAYAALRWLPAFKVGLIGLLEVAAGAAISWLVFQDPLNLRSLSGGALIGLVIFRLKKAPAKAP
ncbi:MAG: DMT family transporter, partial [Candidatus Adiutrix sp.]|nr:DMT family transporter [Candidatus Adiutrix sp.]